MNYLQTQKEQKANLLKKLLKAPNFLPEEYQEIGDRLNGEISTGAKLKAIIRPGILQYEQELVSFSAKESIRSWKDFWRAIVKKSK